jgi:O-antigen ligase
VRLLLIVLLVFTVKTALGAEDSADSWDLFDATSAFASPVRAVVYGLVFLALCLLSIAIPDAPLLVYICSMPIAQFLGLRVALTLLQCAVVFVRTGSVRSLVPSWPLSVFLLCVVASSSWALDPGESFLSQSVGVLDTLLLVPSMISARVLLQSQLTTTHRLLSALTLGCIPGCALILYNALSGITWGGAGEYHMGMINTSIFSPMLVMSGILLLYCLTCPTAKKSTRLFAAILLPLICISLLLTGIRSGWIAFLFAAFLLLLRTRSFVALGGVLAVAALVGLLALSVGSSLNLNEQLESRLSERSLHTGEMRLEYWGIAARGFLKRPVLGIGWGCFPGFAADNTVGWKPVTHNIFVHVLCELGLVGFALFTIWITLTALRMRHCAEGGLVGLLMVGVLLQGFFMDELLHSYFWLFVGICDGVGRNGPSHGMERLESCDHALAKRLNPVVT